MRARIRRFAKSLPTIPSTAKVSSHPTLPIGNWEELGILQGALKNLGLRHTPIRTRTIPPLISHILHNTQTAKHHHPSKRTFPFLPTNLTQPTPKPLITLGEPIRSHSVPQRRVLPPASFPPHLTVTQLPSARPQIFPARGLSPPSRCPCWAYQNNPPVNYGSRINHCAREILAVRYRPPPDDHDSSLHNSKSQTPGSHCH